MQPSYPSVFSYLLSLPTDTLGQIRSIFSVYDTFYKNVQLLAQGHIIGKLQSWGKDSCFLVSYYLYLQQFCETGLGLIVQWGNQSTEKLGNLCNITQLTIWQSREGHQSSLSREMLLLTTDCAPMSSSANKTRRCGTSVVCISLYLLFYITIQY